MQNFYRTFVATCAVISAVAQVGMGAWVGDVIFASYSQVGKEYGVSVAEFDFTRPMNGKRDGTYVNRVSARYEPLVQNDRVTACKDAVVFSRAIVMYDEDTALVLCSLYWGHWDQVRHVWITQLEYDASTPYERDPGPLVLGDIRSDQGTTTGGILSGRLQLAVRPEGAWTAMSSRIPVPSKLYLTELIDAGMFRAENVMDMAVDLGGNLYIAGRHRYTSEGMIYKLPKIGGRRLGPGKGERVGEAMFGQGVQVVSKPTGKSWFTSVAVDDGGFIYTVDRGLSTVDVYDAQGKLVLSYNMDEELQLAPEALRIDPTYTGPGPRLVLNVYDPQKVVKILVLDVDPAAASARVAKKLINTTRLADTPSDDSALREVADDTTCMELIDWIELSPEGDILYVDERGSKDDRHALIAAEDYAKAVVSPDGSTYDIPVVGVDVLQEVGHDYARGGTFAAVTKPNRALISAALKLAAKGQAAEALAQLEEHLQRLKANPSADGGPSGNAGGREAGLLIDTYAAIASVKRSLSVPQRELQAVCYEGLQTAPNAPGVYEVVASLAGALPEAQRDTVLWNLARKFRATEAGRAAANLLMVSVLAGCQDVQGGLEDLAIRGTGTAIGDQAFVRLNILNGRRDLGGDLSQQLRAETLLLCGLKGDKVDASASLLMQCAQRFMTSYRVWKVEDLCRLVLMNDPRTACLPAVSGLLVRSRVLRGDYVGALAAVAARPDGSERSALARQIAQAATLADVRAHVTHWVEATCGSADGRVVPDATASDIAFYRELGAVAEQLNLPIVGTVCWQEILRSRQVSVIDAATGSALSEDFAVRTAKVEHLAVFWKALLASADGKPEEAARLLMPLADATSAPLRGQVLFELARARLAQHRPQVAVASINECVEELPSSEAARELHAAADSEIRSQEATAQAFRQWAQLRKAADDAPDDDRAAEALLGLADIELQLGAPRKAVVVLEEAVRQHPTAVSTTQSLRRLVSLYRDELHDEATGGYYESQLAKESSKSTPTSQPGAAR
ncbi:MAG TPA: hypothetical protein VMZ31_05245 [Phycisphaerae bacterium]|nr:hypothetical protein [Phycisphaerae bacterium]